MNSPTGDEFGLEQQSVRADRTRTRIALRGGIDIVDSATVTSAIRRQLDIGQTVIVDLADVTFMDSSGVAAIVKSPRDENERGRLGVLPSRHRQPQRVCDMTALSQYLLPEPVAEDLQVGRTAG